MTLFPLHKELQICRVDYSVSLNQTIPSPTASLLGGLRRKYFHEIHPLYLSLTCCSFSLQTASERQFRIPRRDCFDTASVYDHRNQSLRLQLRGFQLWLHRSGLQLLQCDVALHPETDWENEESADERDCNLPMAMTLCGVFGAVTRSITNSKPN